MSIEVLDHPVDEPVVDGLLGRVPAVAQRVRGDALDRLAGVFGDDAEHRVARLAQVVGLQFDVDRRTADARRALVHEHAGVRQREPLARRARGEQELPGARGPPDRDRRHVVRDRPHHVHDREHRGHRAAG